MSDHDPWPAPASDEPHAPRDAAFEVSLDKADRMGRTDSADEGGEEGKADGGSVHDRRTVASFPGAPPQPSAPGVPQPWAAPVVPPGPGTFASFPPPNPATAAGGPPPNPFAPPAAQHGAVPLPPNPFAPPAAQHDAVPLPPNPFAPPAAQHGAVPPPPISPDGPGQLPYGYPGGYGYGYPAPAPGGYYWPGAPGGDSNGMGIAGMVLGIVSAVVFCLWPLAIVAGILGIVFGAIGRRKARRGEAANPGQALAGIICGAVGAALAIAFGLLVILTP